MTIKALRFALTVLKHGKHDQSSHGRRGSGGGGLAPATMGARPARPSLQQIIDTARPYADLPIDYTPAQMKFMEQHLQTMQRHMERTEQIRSYHFNPDGTPKTPTSRKECFDELRAHARGIIRDSADIESKMSYPSIEQRSKHLADEGNNPDYAYQMRGNHVNVMNAITLEAWRQNTPGTVPDIVNNNPLLESEYLGVYKGITTLFDYVHTAPGDENAPRFNNQLIELVSKPGSNESSFFAPVVDVQEGEIPKLAINYSTTDVRFTPVVHHEGAHIVQSMKPYHMEADLQYLRDKGGFYPDELNYGMPLYVTQDTKVKTHFPYARTVYYHGKLDIQSGLYRVSPIASEVASTTAENVFGYARGSWDTVKDISKTFTKIPEEAALTYALFNS